LDFVVGVGRTGGNGAAVTAWMFVMNLEVIVGADGAGARNLDVISGVGFL
jgi:hypothetical protein